MADRNPSEPGLFMLLGVERAFHFIVIFDLMKKNILRTYVFLFFPDEKSLRLRSRMRFPEG